MPQKIKALILIGFSLVFFILSTGHIMEGDLFWHIKTGEWIWQNKAIPSEDPFTFTFQKEDPLRPGYLRQEIILKGYWIGQLIYYFIYSLFGIKGIILFRASLLLSVLLLLFLFMRSLNVSFELSLFFLLLEGLWFYNIGDRPHLFSFVIFPAVLFLADSIRVRWSPPKALILLSLMVIWPNLHGGYVTGIAVTGIYLLGCLLKKRIDLRLCLIYAGAILATFLNPNTYKTLLGVFQEMTEGVQAIFIAEMQSPFEAFKAGYYHPEFWLSILITLTVLGLSLKRKLSSKNTLEPGTTLTIEKIVIIILFCSLSLKHQRMIHFFMLSLPFIASEAEIFFGRPIKLSGIVIGFLLFMSALYGSFKEADLFNTDLSELFPVECTEFLNKTMPKGNLFNWSDWGGYLMLKSPEYKVFDDGRRLMDDVEIARSAIDSGSRVPIMGKPAWRAYLDSYEIDIIVIPPVHPLFGQFIGLVKELYLDRDFALIYAKGNCLIYLRRGRMNDILIDKYELPKELGIIRAIEGLHNYRTESERLSKLRLIATLYRLIGRDEAARQYERMLGQ